MKNQMVYEIMYFTTFCFSLTALTFFCLAFPDKHFVIAGIFTVLMVSIYKLDGLLK